MSDGLYGQCEECGRHLFTPEEGKYPATCRECDSGRGVGVCAACGGPADFPDADRVQCDCGTTVCSACCVAVGGESYCQVCAVVEHGWSQDAGEP